MALLELHARVLEKMIFGFSSRPVRIEDATYDPQSRKFTLRIKGQTVPEALYVRACLERTPRGHSLTFVPTDKMLTQKEKEALDAFTAQDPLQLEEGAANPDKAGS